MELSKAIPDPPVADQPAGAAFPPRLDRADLHLAATIRERQAGELCFSRFLLKRLAGPGSVGVVWHAWDESRPGDVALKFLPPLLQRDRQAMSVLRAAVERAAALRHPVLVRPHEVLDDGEQTAIASEWVEGTSLAVLLKQRPRGCCEAGELAPWLHQLCEALEEAHRARLAHGELCPANLLIDRQGNLRLKDLALAMSLGESIRAASGGVVANGRLACLSPQQLTGTTAPADDLYGLGALLYELLTGLPPFYAGDIAAQILSRVPPPVNQRRRELGMAPEATVPPAWEEVVAACLRKLPVERPASPREVLERLGLVARPPRPKALSIAPAPVRRPAWLIAAVVVAAVLGAALGAWYARRPPPDDPVLQFMVRVPTPPPATRESAPVVSRQDAGAAPRLPAPGQPWTNSLNMVFAPLPGGRVLACVWETRAIDLAAFARTEGRVLPSPGFPQRPDHPAVLVSWEDAQAFCAWLTDKERAAQRLRPGDRYRLLTDLEWSRAAGLPDEPGQTPAARNEAVQGQYPWGSQWPPPPNAGNYARSLGTDPFPQTAPVGSFPENRLGFHDLGGNVWEWCEEEYRPGFPQRVLRGASWLNSGPQVLLSSLRVPQSPAFRSESAGFRCAVELGEAQAGSASP
jgi:serine/threonine protein kinase